MARRFVVEGRGCKDVFIKKQTTPPRSSVIITGLEEAQLLLHVL